MPYQSTLRIGVDSRSGERNLRRFEDRLGRTERAGTRVSHTMSRMSTAIKAAAASYVGFGSVRAVRGVIRSTAQLSEMADVADISAERIQELTKSFSDMAGISESITQGGLRRFNRRLDLARDGTGAAVDTLDKLNITLEQDTESALNQAIERLQELAETESITGEASQLFGEDAGPKMAAAIRQGGEALDEQIRKLREHGRVLEEDTVEGARKANDRLNALSDRLSTEFARRVGENAEEIEGLATGLFNVGEAGLEAAGAIGEFSKSIKDSELGQEVQRISDFLPDAISAIFKVSGQGRAVQSLFDAFDDGVGALGRIDPIIIRDWGDETEQAAEKAEVLVRSTRDLSDEFAALKRAAEKRSMELLERDLEDVRRVANPARAELMDLGEQLETLQRTSDKGWISDEQVRRLQVGLVDSLREAAGNGNELVKSFQALDKAVEGVGEDAGATFSEAFERQSDRIGDSLADALMKGEWDGVGSTIGAAVGAGINDVVASSLGPITGGIAGGVAGGIAGQYISDLTENDLPDRGELARIRQEQQFTNTVLGGMNEQSTSMAASLDSVDSSFDQLIGINRGMLRALQRSERGTSRFTASALRGFGDMSFSLPGGNALANAGDFLDDFSSDVIQGLDIATLGLNKLFGSGTLDDLIGDAVGSIFGGDTSVQDRGIRILGGRLEELMESSVVQAYETVKVDGGWFSSDSKETTRKRIGGAIEDQLGTVFSSLTDTLVEASTSLGMDADAALDQLEDFRVKTRNISLMDLSASERQEQIEAFFSSTFDQMANDLFAWTERFQRAGEGLGETLTRLATQNEVVAETHRQLGFAMDRGAMSAQELTGASQDLVNLVGGTEELAGRVQSFTSSFLSDSEQLANMEDQLTRALNQQNLQLPDTRDAYLDLVQAQDAATKSGLENIATLLRLQGTADQFYSEQEQAQEQALSSFRQSIDRELSGIESAMDSLSSGGAGREIRRLDAMEQLRDALLTGDMTGTGEAARAAADIRAQDFGTRQQFLRARGVTANLLSDLQRQGERQKTEAELTVENLDELNLSAKEQLSVLKSIESGVWGGSTPTAPPVTTASTGGGSGLSMPEVVQELRRVQEQLTKLNQYGYQTTKNTGQSAKLHKRWDGDGLPETRTV